MIVQYDNEKMLQDLPQSVFEPYQIPEQGKFVIAVEYDNCIMVNGEQREVEHAVFVLKLLLRCDVSLILLTLKDNQDLTNMIKYMQNRDVFFVGVNRHPMQHKHTSSTKYECDLCIEPKAIGCPLKTYEYDNSFATVVDWYEIERILIQKNIIPNVNDIIYETGSSEEQSTDEKGESI